MYNRIEKKFEEVPQLSSRDIAYQLEDARLRRFYKYSPELTSFKTALEARKKFDVNRDILYEELSGQYAEIEQHPSVKNNIDALREENSFTVITAHQPSLLTGPLYFIYKICSAISLSRQLNRELHGVKIVPLFILGGEDHDFEEIASLRIFGRTITWESVQKGAVGRMEIGDLRDTLDEVISMLGDGHHASDLMEIINYAYSASDSYSAFMFRVVNRLFGEYGLVIANMDKSSFKKQFYPYVEQDIEELYSHRMVNKDQEAIVKEGFKPQAFARQVNLFWHGQDRHRIMLKEDKTYEINGKSYTKKELFDLLKSEPENISPNVIMRPLFQEIIFPNLAYIGGGGEIAYWLERKSLFDHLNIPYPILIRRDSFMIIDSRSQKILNQLNISIEDLFGREEQIINRFTKSQSTTEINLDEAKNEVKKTFDKIAALANEVDPTLFNSVLGEGSKAEKIIEYLEGKLLKAEKRKRATELNKISKLKNKFFPGNDGLQERYDNFIPYYIKYGKNWIAEMINQADPLNKHFKILIEK